MNQMPGPVPQQPTEPIGGMGQMGGGGAMGGTESEDPHEKIIASLTRIEEKLTAIAAKVGA